MGNKIDDLDDLNVAGSKAGRRVCGRVAHDSVAHVISLEWNAGPRPHILEAS